MPPALIEGALQQVGGPERGLALPGEAEVREAFRKLFRNQRPPLKSFFIG